MSTEPGRLFVRMQPTNVAADAALACRTTAAKRYFIGVGLTAAGHELYAAGVSWLTFCQLVVNSAT